MKIEDLKHKGRLYDYNPCGFCGVMMPKEVMEKIAKKATKFQNDVREILNEHRDDLYVSDWSLAYPDGKQTVVKFAHKGDLSRRISLFKPQAPEPLEEVYLAEPRSKEGDFVIEALGGKIR